MKATLNAEFVEDRWRQLLLDAEFDVEHYPPADDLRQLLADVEAAEKELAELRVALSAA